MHGASAVGVTGEITLGTWEICAHQSVGCRLPVSTVPEQLAGKHEALGATS